MKTRNKQKEEFSWAKDCLEQQNYVLLTDVLKHIDHDSIMIDSPKVFKKVTDTFGELLEQYGNSVYHVFPKTTLYSANSAKALWPHSDRNEHPEIKMIAGLFCDNPDRFDQGGYTSICDMTNFISSLSEEVKTYLKTNQFTIIANTILKDKGASHFHGPLLHEFEDGSFHFRFSYNLTQTLVDDYRFLSFRDAVIQYYNTYKIVIKVPHNGLLLFNNHVCLHGRTDIADTNRSLYRLYLKG